MKSSWRIDEFCIFVVSYTAVSVNCTVLQTKHAVDQMQNLNSQFASLLAYDNTIC